MPKTNKGLVEYCKAQLGKPYWYGTFGNTASASLYQAKKKQYPAYYTAEDFSTQYGQRVHDCVGLIKGYLWSETPTSTPKYNSAQDVSANGMRGKCKVSGDINTMPEIIGLLVFMQGHVGVYIGNGEVIEARGHAYGVVKTRLKDRPWKWWGECPYIEYEKSQPKLSIDEVARQVIEGKWGNGLDRVKRLTDAGYDSDVIQKRVNEMLKQNTAPTPTHKGKKYRLTCDWLWVRNKASTITGKKVGKLYKGKDFYAECVGGNWYRITEGEYAGKYVCSGKYQKAV